MVLGMKEKERLQGLLKGAIVQTCLENLSFRCEVDGLVCVSVTMPGGSVDQVVVKMHEVLNGVSAHSYSSTQPSPYSKEPQSGLKNYLSSHKELHASIQNLKYTNDIGARGGIHSNHHHNRAHSRNFSPSVQAATRTTSNNTFHLQHVQAEEETDAPFTCSLCLSNCTTYQELEKHFQDHHTSNITHFCSRCNIGFESETDCSTHRQSVHPQNCSPGTSDFVVAGCGDSSSGRSSAPTSRRKQSKPRKGVAEENLESATADQGALPEWNSMEESDDGSEMTALKIDMAKDALCENNNNDLTQRNHNELGSVELSQVGCLLDNSSSPKELTQYCCPQCREPFGSFSVLEQHCYTDHRLYVCSTCLLTFPQKVNRDRHVYIKHAGCKPFSCDLCGASFTRRDTLKKHKCKGGLNPASFSPSSSSRNSPLVTCKSENDTIKMEVDGLECGLDLSHSSKNRSTCLDVDSKGSFYIENDYLDSGTPQGRSNQNSEEEEDQGGDGMPLALSIKDSSSSPYTALNKKYTCDRCSQVVMGGSAYVDHCKVIHRRTPCLHCGKTFSQKGNMERHKRQHTGERPFQCSECPSSYTRRETLKSHMSQAHGMQLQQQQPLRLSQQSLQVDQLHQQLLLAAAASGGSSLTDTFPGEDDSPLDNNLPEE